jgi:hypothetical protein
VFQERAGRPIRKVCFESGKGNRSMTYIYKNIATCDSVSTLYSSVVESPKRRKNVLLQYQAQPTQRLDTRKSVGVEEVISR